MLSASIESCVYQALVPTPPGDNIESLLGVGSCAHMQSLSATILLPTTWDVAEVINSFIAGYYCQKKEIVAGEEGEMPGTVSQVGLQRIFCLVSFITTHSSTISITLTNFDT